MKARTRNYWSGNLRRAVFRHAVIAAYASLSHGGLVPTSPAALLEASTFNSWADMLRAGYAKVRSGGCVNTTEYLESLVKRYMGDLIDALREVFFEQANPIAKSTKLPKDVEQMLRDCDLYFGRADFRNHTCICGQAMATHRPRRNENDHVPTDAGQSDANYVRRDLHNLMAKYKVSKD